MTEPQKNPQQQIQLRATDADLKGVYSNMAMVVHTQEEFLLDFMNIMGQGGTLSARVIVSPGHMKRLILALEDNMKKYEGQFGNVIPATTPEPSEIGFKT